MNKEKIIYGSLCGIAGVLIGLFANSLNTILGVVVFSLSIAILVFSLMNLNK